MAKFDISKFAEALAVPNSDTAREEIVYLPLEQLRSDTRNFYQLTEIDELAANIELLGLQQPLRVRRDGDGYVIVSGHRRCAALRKLAAEGNAKFAETACIVEPEGDSPAMAELRLIYANASTRTLTGAELATQAARVQELLYKLKEEGVEFPGRMRDHVAEACKISKSKLARLSFIQDHLSADFAYLWEKGKLPEATAYELAHFPDYFQQRVARLFRGGKELPTADQFARFSRCVGDKLDYVPVLKCPNGKPCSHGDTFLRRDLIADSWESLCKGETCCLKCEKAAQDWSPCERMCSAAKTRRAERRARENAKADDKARREHDEKLRSIRRTCALMVRAADAAGLGDDVKAQDGCYGNGGHSIGLLRRYAQGKFESCENPLLYDFELERCTTLAKCAQTLHCSTDYLLGLTDELNPAPSAPAEGWIPVQFVDRRERPPRAGEYWLRLDCGGTEIYSDAQWNAALERWEFLNGTKIDAKCLGWYPLPPRRKENNDGENEND